MKRKLLATALILFAFAAGLYSRKMGGGTGGLAVASERTSNRPAAGSAGAKQQTPTASERFAAKLKQSVSVADIAELEKIWPSLDDQARKLLLFEYIRKDPYAALLFVDKFVDRGKNQFLQTCLISLGKQNSQIALQWLNSRSFDNRIDRDNARSALMAGWASVDAIAAAKYCMESWGKESLNEKMCAAIVPALAQKLGIGVVSWLNDLQDVQIRSRAFATVAHQLIRQNPEETLSWMLLNQDLRGARPYFTEGFQFLAATDLQLAERALAEVRSKDLRHGSILGIAKGLFEKSPAEASNWIGNLEPSTSRDLAWSFYSTVVLRNSLGDAVGALTKIAHQNLAFESRIRFIDSAYEIYKEKLPAKLEEIRAPNELIRQASEAVKIYSPRKKNGGG